MSALCLLHPANIRDAPFCSISISRSSHAMVKWRSPILGKAMMRMGVIMRGECRAGATGSASEAGGLTFALFRVEERHGTLRRMELWRR
jgi:hypothetical protein